MSLAIVHSRALNGVEAIPVTVEVHLSGGLPNLSIVGLPETAVKESKDRVRAAIKTSMFEYPRQRITVNLAPADLPKEGGRYDLPIALGILAASGQVDREALAHYEFVGELALSGELREIRGALPTAVAVAAAHRALILPDKNADEAAMAGDIVIHAADSLLTVCAHLNASQKLSPHIFDRGNTDLNAVATDLRDVKGQYQAKRALEIAAAGRHNLLMVGPPGTGKSMLAARLPSILPELTQTAAMEAAAIASISDSGFQITNWKRSPFRSPHHTCSGVALVGGGSVPKPGEISLAHRGVLFLDELPEFDRKVLDVLREPMESGHITISRAARQADFPADFQLVAAMNPCPCGNLDDPRRECLCTATQVTRYRAKLSGPFLDRIDLHIEVPRVDREALQQKDPRAESSAEVRQRVVAARNIQLARSNKVNAHLSNSEIDVHCGLANKDAALLDRVIQRLDLSARAYHRVLKVARTIADLGTSKNIATAHLTEAVSFHRLERNRTSSTSVA